MREQLRCILPKWNPRKQQHRLTYLVPLKRPSRFSTKTELTFYLENLSFAAKITCRNVSQIADVWDISFQPKSFLPATHPQKPGKAWVKLTAESEVVQIATTFRSAVESKFHGDGGRLWKIIVLVGGVILFELIYTLFEIGR